LEEIKTQNSASLNYNIEILRIISSFGIVYYHGVQGTIARVIGFTSLTIFMLISSYLLIPQNFYSVFLHRRVSRLLVPWFFWFLIYGLFRLMSGKAFLPENDNIISAVLAGTKYHLWYLPFLFVASILLVSYYRIIEYRSCLKKFNLTILISASIILLIASPIWRPWSLDSGSPWSQWLLMLPLLFIGAASSNLNIQVSELRKKLLYSFIIIMLSIWLILTEHRDIGIVYLFGFLMFAAAVFLKFNFKNNSKIIINVSRHTYGIFLIFPFIYSMEKLLGISEYFISPFLNYALSLLIITTANKIPLSLIKKVI